MHRLYVKVSLLLQTIEKLTIKMAICFLTYKISYVQKTADQFLILISSTIYVMLCISYNEHSWLKANKTTECRVAH